MGKAFPSGLLLRRAALPLLAGTPRNAPQEVAIANSESSTPLRLQPETVLTFRRTFRSGSASLRPPPLHFTAKRQTVSSYLSHHHPQISRHRVSHRADLLEAPHHNDAQSVDALTTSSCVGQPRLIAGLSAAYRFLASHLSDRLTPCWIPQPSPPSQAPTTATGRWFPTPCASLLRAAVAGSLEWLAPHPSIGVPGVHGKIGIPEGALLPYGIFP